MLRLKAPKNGLALPTSTPVTLIEVDSNLPYAIQCPCCGVISQLSETLLYKIEDDDFTDVDSNAEFSAPTNNAPTRSSYSDTFTPRESSPMMESEAGGDFNDTAL